MKKTFCFLLMSTLFVQTSWGQQSCPLTNSKLTDLRTAASKLATTIKLSGACKSYEDTVNKANADLKDIAGKIDAAGNTDNVNPAENKQTALQAVAHLESINSVFKNNKCGQELASFADYASNFVDIVNGMVPFLALYGGAGAMPWVLGPAIGGAAAKAIITFFQNKSLNMRNPDQSNAFIKNSCAFYNLDIIKNSIDDLQLNQSTKLDDQVQKARTTLSNLIKNAPHEPDNDLTDRLELAVKDQSRIKYLQDQFKADPIEACIYISAYASHNDNESGTSMVERVWNNYEETIKDKAFRLDLEKKYFVDDLNAQAANIEPAKCASIGLRWINKLISLSDAGIASLQSKVVQNDDVKAYAAWKADKAKAEEDVKVLEAKVGFFQDLTSKGFNIEYSEIIRSHQQVQDSIFDSYKYIKILKVKGLAEAWLKVKQEDAFMEAFNFRQRKKEVEERIKKIEKVIGVNHDLTSDDISNFASSYQATNRKEHNEVHRNVGVDVCNELRRTWASWYNGNVHARAGRDYCVTFNKVINKMDYPAVQNLCFGTTTKRGKKVNSLKNLVLDFRTLKAEADQVAQEMRNLSCQNGADLTKEVLSLPLN